MENIMSKIHIWVGETQKSDEEFYKYFENNMEEIQSEISGSPFAKDIGIIWYDDDLIGVYKNDSNKDLEVVLDELPISPEKMQEVYNICIDNEIKNANALFYYADGSITIIDKIKKYNDLIYIGCIDRD